MIEMEGTVPTLRLLDIDTDSSSSSESLGRTDGRSEFVRVVEVGTLAARPFGVADGPEGSRVALTMRDSSVGA
jgi:hypothetical protein